MNLYHAKSPLRCDRIGGAPRAALFSWILLLCLLNAPLQARAGNDTLVLQFTSGSAALSTLALQNLTAFMADVELGIGGKVLVVGHADGKGEHKSNLAISRKRAKAVKNALIDKLGTAAEKILATSQGDDAPVATNETEKGRAQNRRVVVRLIGVAPPDLQRRYGAHSPKLAQIDTLLNEADTKLRRGKLEDALADLNRVAELGGDKFGRWHTSYGILGFLGGQPPYILKPYFQTALTLDPHDTDAREFLGRVEAREAFFQGRIRPQMGLNRQRPIKVATRSQAYEYLQMFEVEPLSHHTLAPGSIDAWTCRTATDEIVTYYFDTSSQFHWAYPSKDL